MPVRSMGEEFFSIESARRLACISYQIEEPSPSESPVLRRTLYLLGGDCPSVLNPGI